MKVTVILDCARGLQLALGLSAKGFAVTCFDSKGKWNAEIATHPELHIANDLAAALWNARGIMLCVADQELFPLSNQIVEIAETRLIVGVPTDDVKERDHTLDHIYIMRGPAGSRAYSFAGAIELLIDELAKPTVVPRPRSARLLGDRDPLPFVE